MILWSLSSYAQDLTSCGTGYFMDLSVGYTTTGQGLELCGCSDVASKCELVHIILRRSKDNVTDLLDCPDITLTERWWREEKDLVDIFYATTCEELEESSTHSDRYEIKTEAYEPGDTISLLVCKTNAFDNNIIELSASPGPSCNEFSCIPKMSCPVEFKLRKNLDCSYILPDFRLGVSLEDTCFTPGIDVTDQYTLMQTPAPGTLVTEDLFVEIKVATEEGEIVATCDVSVLLAADVPPFIFPPSDIEDVREGEELPPIEDLLAVDTISDGELFFISTTKSIDSYDETPCAGYEMTYRWVATDTCGLTSEVTRSFRVLPNDGGPIFASLPADIDTIHVGESFPILVDLIAVNPDGTTDGITVSSSIDSYEEDDCYGYDVTYRWRASDVCSDETEVTTTFYVEPNGAPPVFQLLPEQIKDFYRSETLPEPENVVATSIDGDTMGIQVEISIDTLASDPCEPNQLTYTWTAVDTCGLSSSVSRTFNILPDTLTGFLISEDEDMKIEVSIECSQTAAIEIPIDLDRHDDKSVIVTVTDDEWNVLSEYEYSGPEDYNFETGESHVIYQISDLCGNEVRDTINIQAADVSAPVFICPGQQEIQLTDFSSCATAAIWEVPQAFDNCNDIMITQMGGPEFGSAVGVGTYDIMYEATDESSNTSQCSFRFIVTPVDSTSLKCLPIEVEIDALCIATLTKEAVVGSELLICAPNLEMEVIVGYDTLRGETFELGQYLGQEIKYTLCETDLGICCENQINLIDNLSPIISCIDTITLSCLVDLNQYRPDVAGECGDVTWKIKDLDYVSICNDPNLQGILKREYIAVDASGNESLPCVQVINISYANVDNLLIESRVSFPIDTTIACEDYNENSFSTTSYGQPMIDSIIISVEENACGISASYIDEPYYNSGCTKIIKRNWVITEQLCGYGSREIRHTQNIKVVDKIAPEINTKEDTIAIFTNIHDCFGTFSLSDVDYVVEDNCQDSLDIRISMFYGGKNYTSKDSISLPFGINHIVISVEDLCRNQGRDTIVVSVKDNIRPVAVCLEYTTFAIAGERATFSVESLNTGSYDNCDLVSVQVRKLEVTCTKQDTIFGDKVQFCCEEVGDTITLLLKTIDHVGNVNYCTGIVSVQDKIAPTISCPPDIVISCNLPLTVSTDPEDPYGHLFGRIKSESNRDTLPLDDSLVISSIGLLKDGVFTDNCDADVQITVTTQESLNNCGIGYIYRSFVAVDESGNPSRRCTQKIEIRSAGALDTSLINWPEEEVIIEQCSNEGSSISIEALGRPTIDGEACALYGVSHEDTYFDFTDDQSGTCSKIVRTWTLIDWCDDAAVEKSITRSQTIKISDGEAPQITECSVDNEIYTSGIVTDCGDIPIELYKRAFDQCTSEENLSWNIDIDFNNDGLINVRSNPKLDSSGVYYKDMVPVGRHKVIWTVQDQCGNQSECIEYLTVDNAKAPTPIAYGISTSLSSSNRVEVWASDLILKTEHPCYDDIEIWISKESESFEDARSSLIFTCDEQGVNLVKAYASRTLRDGSSVYDHVVVKVDVEDNFNSCSESVEEGSVAGAVKGLIYTEDGRLVPKVTVQLNQSFTDLYMGTDTSDNSGSYDIGHIENGSSYYLTPDLQADPLDGLNTFDLVLLQRHIMGLNKFDTPYKIISADINRDKRVTASDILDLRRAVLRLSSSFDTHDSWRFINSDYKFEDARYPLNDDLDKKIYFAYQQASVDLVAMKVGDFNGSVKLEKQVAEGRSIHKLTTDDIFFRAGEEQTVEFKTQANIDLHGYQMTLSYDPTQTTVVDISSSIEGLELAYNEGGLGEIFISASSAQPKLIGAKDPLFTLTIKAKVDGRLKDHLAMSDGPLFPEIYTGGLDSKNISLIYTSVPTGTFEIRQNAPNPFALSTDILMDIPETGDVELSVYDTQGKVFLQKTLKLQRGKHSIKIEKDDLGGPGVYYYIVKYGAFTETSKMILMN